ncbi:MAG: SURF1 family protein [Gemmatimonadetes bacterium]|nr:SURF1 family protein [Gemmatimonadota bacterium]
MSPTRRIVTLLITLSVAAVCIRLGFWQVGRLREKQAYNQLLTERLGMATLAAALLPGDTGVGRYRRATLTGAADYPREIAWGPRMRNGSPGVHFLTPVPFGGGDSAILVDRGWAYSADARTTDFGRWREGDSISASGYTETWVQPCGAGAQGPLPPTCGDSVQRLLRRLDRTAAERLVGRPLAPYILMQTSDSALRADSVPVRVGLPAFDEGPHRGYAFQWFAFAAVAIAGGVLLVRAKPPARA